MPERYHIVVLTDPNQKYLHSAPNHNKDEIAIATKTPAEPKSFAKPDSG